MWHQLLQQQAEGGVRHKDRCCRSSLPTVVTLFIQTCPEEVSSPTNWAKEMNYIITMCNTTHNVSILQHTLHEYLDKFRFCTYFSILILSLSISNILYIHVSFVSVQVETDKKVHTFAHRIVYCCCCCSIKIKLQPSTETAAHNAHFHST